MLLIYLLSYLLQTVSGKSSYGFLSVMESSQNDTVEVGPGNLKLSFSSTSGQLKRIYNSKTEVSIHENMFKSVVTQ